MRFISGALSVFKYFIAIFMMIAGVSTALSEPTPLQGPVGIFYSTKTSLIIFGIIFFFSGFFLFYGKVRRKRRIVGWALMSIFCCFLFAALLSAIAYGLSYGTGNFVCALIVGALYIRWKLMLFYAPRRSRHPVIH